MSWSFIAYALALVQYVHAIRAFRGGTGDGMQFLQTGLLLSILGNQVRP